MNINSQLSSELISIVSKETASYSNKVLQTGHFMLNYNVTLSGSCMEVHADDDNVSLKDFAIETWKVGTELIHTNTIDKLLMLVNDWQGFTLIKNKISDHSNFNDLKNDVLFTYYSHTKKFPSLLQKYNLQEAVIEKRTSDSWMFSESALRDEFYMSVMKDLEPSYASIRNIRENGKEYIRYYSNSDELSDFTENDYHNLICENTADCAGEVIQLLSIMKKRGIQCFVNFYPESCWRYVNIGCILAKKLLNDDSEMKVVNIAIDEDLSIDNLKLNIHYV